MKATLPTTSSGNLSVINGTATTSLTGSTLAITATDKTVLSWVNFWDGTANGGTSAAGDVLNYILPSASSAVLNSVNGGLLTTINGEILSNGKVYIMNPSGITIGATGIVNAAGFGLSTLAENFSNFEATGSLVAFGSPAGAAAAVTVTPGASITTVGGSGNVYLAGSTVALSGIVTGNAFLYTNAGAVTVGSGATTVSGGLTIATNNGGVTLGNGAATNVQGALAITTKGGALNLSNGGAVAVSGNTTIDTSVTSGTNGSITEGGAGSSFAASVAGTTTTITTGTTAPGTITLSSADFANLVITSAGATSITDTTANTLNLGTATINGNLTVNAAGNISSNGNVAVTGGAISLTTTATNGTIAFTTSAAATNFSALVANTGTAGSVTVTSTGSVNIGGVVTPTLTVSATSIGELSAITTGKAANFTATTGGIYLDSFVNAFTGTTKFIGAPSGTYVDSGAITIGNGTATTGFLQITANGNVALGTASADVISVGGALGVDLSNGAAGLTLTTASTNVTVGGNVGLYGNASLFTLGKSGTTTSSFGSIAAGGTNVAAGSVTINEGSTTNLGGSYTFLASTTAVNGGTASQNAVEYLATATPAGLTITGDKAAALTVASMGNIINPTGAIVVTGTTTVSAGTAAAPGTITLGSTATPFDAAAATVAITDGLSSSLTLTTNSAAVNITSALAATALGNLSVDDHLSSGAALTVTASGGTVGFSGLSFNMTNGSVVYTADPTAITLSNATNTYVALSTPAITLTTTGTAAGITLGTGINILSQGTDTFTAGGNLVDTAGSSFYLAGATTFTSAGSINLANGTNNNVGAVTLVLNGTSTTSSIAYAEGSTVKLAGITIAPAGDTGTVSISSATGDILQSAAINLSADTALTGVTFSAPKGAVTLTTAGNLIGTTAAAAVLPITIVAANNSALTVGDSVLLNNVVISNGGLAINTTADGTTGVILEKTKTYTYGNPTFTTAGAAVTLTTAGNNFGAIAVDTTNAGAVAAGASVSIRETGTNNYSLVATGTGGAFTAVDDSGDIIETPAATITVGGLTTLTALNGSILLNDPVAGAFPASTGVNKFGGAAGILATAGNSIAITDGTASTVLLDGTKAGTGTLTIINTSTNGTISDSGASATITSGGNAYFSTLGTGFLNLQGLNNSFGAIGLNLGSGTSTLNENATTNLLAGSQVAGNLTINTGGAFITSGSGTISVAGAGGLTINALTSIVFSNAVNVKNGVLTVKAISGPTNLSVDSISANLDSALGAGAVVNNGNTTNYTGPTP